MCFSQIRGKEADIRFFANITLNSIHSLLIMFEILKKMHFKKVIKKAHKRCEGCVCSTPGPAVWSVRLWATLALLLSARKPAVKEGEVITYKELKGT